MKSIFSLFFLLSVGFSSFAQAVLSPAVFDFGTVAEWTGGKFEITVKNKGKEPMHLLPTFSGRLKMQSPKEAVPAGGEVKLNLQYLTDKTGAFEERFPIYVSNASTPVMLVVKGNILRISDEVAIDCPPMPGGSGGGDKHALTIVVLDSLKRTPVKGAVITLMESMGGVYQSDTDGEGKSKFSPASSSIFARITAEGYKPLEKNLPLRKTTTEVTVLLRVDPDYVPESKEIALEKPTETKAGLSSVEEYTAEGKLSDQFFKPNHLIFLLDISGSMKDPAKLPFTKQCMMELVERLRKTDYVTVLTYSSKVDTVVLHTSAGDGVMLKEKISKLEAKGATMTVNGLKKAYEVAKKHLLENGNNQVILTSDGLFQNSSFNEEALTDMVSLHAGFGIRLSVISFGENPDGIRILKKMANTGEGSYISAYGRSDINMILEDVKQYSRK